MAYIICFICFKLATSCIGQIPPLHSTGHHLVDVLSSRHYNVHGWAVDLGAAQVLVALQPAQQQPGRLLQRR